MYVRKLCITTIRRLKSGVSSGDAMLAMVSVNNVILYFGKKGFSGKQ